LYFALLIFSLFFVLISLATARVLLPCRQAIQLTPASEMTYIVSSGALNSTHSLYS